MEVDEILQVLYIYWRSLNLYVFIHWYTYMPLPEANYGILKVNIYLFDSEILLI